MPTKFANNAVAKIATPPSGTTGLSFTVESTYGTRFPTLDTGEWCYVTFKDAALNREIVKITARTSDSFAIDAAGRGFDGTTARTWLAGDIVELCVVRASLLDMFKSFWNVAGSFAATFTNSNTAARTYTFQNRDGTIADLGANSFVGTQAIVGLLDISGSSSGQIRFPVAQNASTDPNTLDDYEEGIWTPSFVLGSGSATYTVQLGTYTKIGNQVTAICQIVVNVATTPSGTLEVSGIPFNTSANSLQTPFSTIALGWNGSTHRIVGLKSAATSRLRLFDESAGALTNPGGLLANGCELNFTVTYLI